MNTMKKNGGFTLVELIIVIAILAILSTGAIAGYSRYIENANNTAVKAELSDIYTAAVLANAKTGAVTVTVGEEATQTGKVLKVVVTNAGDDFKSNFEASIKVISGANNNGTYTATIKLPSAWSKSKEFSGKTDLTLPVSE